jgi:hypothetical protein
MLPDLYVEVLSLCPSLGMVGLGHIAFDGTKLKASFDFNSGLMDMGCGRRTDLTDDHPGNVGSSHEGCRPCASIKPMRLGQ